MKNKKHHTNLLTKLLTLMLLPAAVLLAAMPAAAQTHKALLDIEDATNNIIMQVYDDSGLLLTGTYNPSSGVIPAEGAGVRLMWYPAKAAFRVGHVTGSEWDDSNIGHHSVALGYNTTASGSASTAMGGTTTASGIGSTAMGIGTVAASRGSLSIGQYNAANNTEDGTLFVVGNGYSFVNRTDALILDEDGNLWIAGNLTESSDIRLKTDIEPLGKVLKQVLSIQPLRYRFKPNTGHPKDMQIGLSAQEVQKAFPALVQKGSEGYLALSYSKFTTVLLKAIQEQQKIINKQQTQIEKLRDHMQTLETQLRTNRRLMKRVIAVGVGR